MNMSHLAKTFAGKTGIDVTKMENGKSEGVLNIRDDHLNSVGKVHGGVFCTMADVLCAVSVISKIPGDLFPITTDFNISFLKAVQKDQIRGVAEALHIGGRTAYSECSLYSGDTLVARATATFAILKRQ